MATAGVGVGMCGLAITVMMTSRLLEGRRVHRIVLVVLGVRYRQVIVILGIDSREVAFKGLVGLVKRVVIDRPWWWSV